MIGLEIKIAHIHTLLPGAARPTSCTFDHHPHTVIRRTSNSQCSAYTMENTYCVARNSWLDPTSKETVTRVVLDEMLTSNHQEQLYNNHRHALLVQQKTNIWTCGAVIHFLMADAAFQSRNRPITQNRFRRRNTRWLEFNNHLFRTFGEDIINSPYSLNLVELVHRCLANDPRKRANQLWEMIVSVLNQ
jgi:hypothetical protein